MEASQKRPFLKQLRAKIESRNRLLMFNVIDTIDFRNSWIHRYPEWLERGEGVLVILDPEQINQAPEVQGLTVTIYKPDGSISHFVANSSERPQTMVGIFFKDIISDEIPRGSKIEW